VRQMNCTVPFSRLSSICLSCSAVNRIFATPSESFEGAIQAASSNFVGPRGVCGVGIVFVS
jgi:hypothetical protein